MDPILEPKLKMYSLLREEVMQSIRIQQQIFIVELISIILGSFIICYDLGLFPSLNIDMRILLFLIPLASGLFTLLWLIEQSRMMRAGNFLELLEDDINSEGANPCILWENWLRRPKVSWLDVHRIHHISQFILIVSLMGIGVYSSWKILDIFHQWIIFSLYIGLLGTIFFLLLFTLIHGNYSLNEKDKRKTEYNDFKNQYRQNICINLDKNEIVDEKD